MLELKYEHTPEMVHRSIVELFDAALDVDPDLYAYVLAIPCTQIGTTPFIHTYKKLMKMIRDQWLNSPYILEAVKNSDEEIVKKLRMFMGGVERDNLIASWLLLKTDAGSAQVVFKRCPFDQFLYLPVEAWINGKSVINDIYSTFAKQKGCTVKHLFFGDE